MNGKSPGIGIDELYFAALEHDNPDALAAYLDEACGADSELRRRVEQLLDARCERGSFLESPALGPTGEFEARTGPEEGPGTTIGPYKLLEQIGEGGFGVVFMAEQILPVRRKVALKVLKPGMDTRQVIARFEAERQALAIMDHPNIAKVLDGGATPSGRPYFVMDLVKGVPITDFCDQNHLTPRQRLELFIQVCQAVQHAHQKGIIHRDLKPSNMLVTLHDGVPVPKVIDFGVAKALGQELTEKTLFTGFAQMIGTPQYMSPEQAGQSGLDVDTRSDVYSLGVLLYELLTGTTPLTKERFSRASYDEIQRIIREEEPPTPSTRLSTLGRARLTPGAGGTSPAERTPSLATVSEMRQTEPAKLTKLMRGELDWIVMKCLEKDRNRRYETANSLARDIERHLHDEPVQACPPSKWYRLRKLVRRHKGAVLATSLLVLALVAGIVGTTRERIRADLEKARAEANLQKAREVVDRMFTKVALDLAHTPRMEKVRRGLLVDALEFYQAFLKANGTNPTLGYESALANIKVGDIHVVLGRYDLAEDDWRQSIATLEQLSTRFPDVPEYREKLAYCFGELGWTLSHQGRPEEGINERRREVDLRQKLVSDFPRIPDFRRELALAHTDLGICLAERFDDAEHHYRQALMHWEKLRADFPEVPEDREGLAHLHHSWGSLLLTTNRLQEAEQEFRKVLELRERLVADEPGNSELKHLLAQIHDYLGYLLLQRRKRAEGVLAQRLTEEAEHQFRRCVQLCETLIEDFPDTPDYRRRLVAAYSHLSEPLMLMGRVQEAIGAVRRAISEDDKLITNSSQADESYLGAGRSYHRLGVLLQAEGRVQEAADAFREAKNRLERAATRNPRGSLWLRTLAFFLATCPAAQFRDVDRAITLARQALQLAPLVPDSWYVLGLAEYRAGHWAAAIEAFEKSAKLGWVLDAQAAFFLAMAHWQLDHKNEARQWYDQAVGLIERPNWPTEDLPRLRAEAAKLLGLPEPTAPERKEVPRPTRD